MEGVDACAGDDGDDVVAGVGGRGGEGEVDGAESLPPAGRLRWTLAEPMTLSTPGRAKVPSAA